MAQPYCCLRPIEFQPFSFYYSPYMLTAKQRDSSLQVFDDLTPPYTQRSISLGKPSMMPYAYKLGETEHSIPIPLHMRAASSPAHIEAQRNEQVHSNHKRYPSCVETSPRQYASNCSSDSCAPTCPADDRHSKRASSECKENLNKRNASSPAVISLSVSAALNKSQNFHPNDRNRIPVKPSPELLAQLLRGSSEKMTMKAERERNEKLHAKLYTLPVAVQQLSVSIRCRAYFTFTIRCFCTFMHKYYICDSYRSKFDFNRVQS